MKTYTVYGLIALAVLVILACTCGRTTPDGQTPIVVMPTLVPRPTPPPPPPPSPTPVQCLPDVTFVQDVTVPDGTEFAPGQQFTKVWRIRSSGCAPWPDGTRLVFVQGHQMGAPLSVPVPKTALGSTADVSVPMQAPGGPGTYSSAWRAEAPNGILFGDQVFARIVVLSLEAPDISFVADRFAIKAGECATLSWQVGNALAVRYAGQDVAFAGSRLECPLLTTSYRLDVQRLDGQWVAVTIEIAVEQTAY